MSSAAASTSLSSTALRKARDVIDAVRLAPAHRLFAAIMAVAADGDARVGPMPADAADEAAQPAADFLARWRFAGAQDHRHRAAGCGVVNMDRQKAALVVMGVPF